MDKVKLTWRERTSDSDFIASVWMCQAPEAMTRTVLADPCVSLLLVKGEDSAEVSLRGPETEPRSELLLPGYTWTAIRLQPGVVLRGFTAQDFINDSLMLPTDGSSRFEFGGVRWRFPRFENAELLIQQLHTAGYLSYDVGSQTNPRQGLSSRSYSRLIKHATGLSPYKLHQLQRIHQALQLLKAGVSATAVAADLGFVDQAHLTRAAKQFLGHTPKELRNLPQIPQ